MTELKSQGGLASVIDGGFCIGCGACSVANTDVQMEESTDGLYQARLIARSGGGNAEVCPFSAKKNENDLGRTLYGVDTHHDSRVGYYRDIYAGHVEQAEFRKNGSSGGLVTWVLGRLFDLGEIDGVIHVGETGQPGELFEYRVSETRADIVGNAKSRYYPVHMDDVVESIRNSSKKYAFVGVPCFVKAIRLLADQDEQVAERIKYCISIFCGHFKTKAFAEMIAWQQHVIPSQLAGINFRVKYEDKPANQYGVQVLRRSNAHNEMLPSMPTRNLYGMDWGLGYFKPKACDWCDDIAGETADLACGDAWLPEFSDDSGGTNIVVVRHKRLAELISEGIREGQLTLTRQTADKVYESQAGNYRHRQEGLAVRVAESESCGEWHPPKRIEADSFQVSAERARIYKLRGEVAALSHEAFREAKEKSSFLHFYLKMLPLEVRYYFINKRLIKGTGKSVLALLHLMRRRLGKLKG